jgi:hypothetical protein
MLRQIFRMKIKSLLLTAIASVTIASIGYSQSLTPIAPDNTGSEEAPTPKDDGRFFSGAHLGMTIDQCVAYYRNIADGGILEHSGAPRGEVQIDFRTASVPQRRVYFYFRKSDRKIVSVTYWKLGANETFSQKETQIEDEYKADSGTEFEVTTAKQYRLEQAQN